MIANNVECVFDGLIILLNSGFDVLVNYFFDVQQDYVQEISDSIQAFIAILTLLHLRRRFTTSYKETSEKSMALKQALTNDTTGTQVIEKLNGYSSEAINIRKGIIAVLIFLLLITTMDILIANVSYFKSNKTAQDIRKIAFPSCWLFEFIAVYGLYQINSWHDYIVQIRSLQIISTGARHWINQRTRNQRAVVSPSAGNGTEDSVGIDTHKPLEHATQANPDGDETAPLLVEIVAGGAPQQTTDTSHKHTTQGNPQAGSDTSVRMQSGTFNSPIDITAKTPQKSH